MGLYTNHVTSTIVIEDAIPLPGLSRNGGARRKYPFPDLEVGQSFAIPGGLATANALRTASCHYANREGLGKRFSVSKVSDPGKVRVWRIA